MKRSIAESMRVTSSHSPVKIIIAKSRYRGQAGQARAFPVRHQRGGVTYRASGAAWRP
jgi:hypothetical protein